MIIKVFHVVRQYHPSIGGLEDVVYNIARQQLASGTQLPTIITLNRLFRGDGQTLPAYEMREGIPVVRLPYRGSARYPLCGSVLSALAEADVVHVHGIDFFFDFLALTKPWHHKKLVASTHGIFFHTPFASGFKKVFFNSVTRMSALAYRRIFATSANDGRLFSLVCSPDRIEVIENGVNIDKFRQPERQHITKRIIYFGRWSENKGLQETLALFQVLWQADMEWQFVIAGREYDLTCDELQTQIAQLGLETAVTLLPNPDEGTLRQQIGEASYFICLSHHEGFGLAAIEAMSGGLIPLLSPIPPFIRLIDETGLGCILPADCLAAVAQIQQLHQRVSADEGAMTRQLVRAVQHYSWQEVAKRYMAAYADLVAGISPMETLS